MALTAIWIAWPVWRTKVAAAAFRVSDRDLPLWSLCIILAPSCVYSSKYSQDF